MVPPEYPTALTNVDEEPDTTTGLSKLHHLQQISPRSVELLQKQQWHLLRVRTMGQMRRNMLLLQFQLHPPSLEQPTELIEPAFHMSNFSSTTVRHFAVWSNNDWDESSRSSQSIWLQGEELTNHLESNKYHSTSTNVENVLEDI